MDRAGLVMLAVLITSMPSAITVLLDYGTIYRLPGAAREMSVADVESTTVSLEVYLRTNALGRLLKTRNGTYLEPKVTVLPLGCPHAVFKCSWERESSWAVKHNSVPYLLTIELGGSAEDIPFPDACANNNGDCQVTCTLSNSTTACSCPLGYSLSSDQKSCSGDSSSNSVLSGNSGGLGFRRNPDSNVDQLENHMWLIIGPPKHIIKLIFTHFSIDASELVCVFDGDNSSAHELGHFDSSNIPRKQIFSTQNKMLVTFASYNSNSNFEAHYITERQMVEEETFLALSDKAGMFKSPPMIPKSRGLCVSVIHKEVLSAYKTLRISAKSASGEKLNLTRRLIQVVGSGDEMWQINRFTATLLKEDIGKPLTLSAYFTGWNSAVYSIVGCNAYEDEDVYKITDFIGVSRIPTPEIIPENQSDTMQHCYNGGVPSRDRSSQCHCPAGFSGHFCEEACGPNSYGDDCEGICSSFVKKCYKMIFCVQNLPCMCAPGLTGEQCDQECSPGYYGASCRKPCGHCLHGPCDIYTGYCKGGCSTGFYSPLCQDSYQQLTITLTVEHVGLTAASISANLSTVISQNIASFYQVQFKEKNASYWLELQPEVITSDIIYTDITHLQSDVTYEARVVIIDNNGYSYHENGVPTVEFQTLCIVPTSDQYHIKVLKVTNTSFELTWKYDVLDSNWCSVIGYEVSFQDYWRQHEYHISAEEFKIICSDLQPGEHYAIKICALTKHGMAPYSLPLLITTLENIPGEVMKLEVTSGGANKLYVTWDEPEFIGGKIRQYKVEYQCLQLLACSEPCDHSSGAIEASYQARALVLNGLLPYARYEVRVAARTIALGPHKSACADTNYTGTNMVPDTSPIPIIERSSTSFTAQWKAPANCSGLNGRLLGYRYELMAILLHGQKFIRAGTTEHSYIGFADLNPSTQYVVQVYLVTSAGWNPRHKLNIAVTTMATTPEEVQGLTVYKRGQHMVGIRWAPPLMSYGAIKSFTVTHRQVDKDSAASISTTVFPVHCSAWPELYCHTINHLEPVTSYLVTVQARNAEIDVDGRAVTVEASTFEEAPTVPTFLMIVNHTYNSLWLQWGPPDMINGILQSYVLNIEQIDNVNVSNCCEHLLNLQLAVQEEEQPLYHYEVMNLNPASTLSISISAKTVTTGPSANVFTIIPPEPPTQLHRPELLNKSPADIHLSVKLQPADEYEGLQSTYLVLILPPNDKIEPVIWDKDLSKQLQMVVNHTFYVAKEYKRKDLLGGKVVNLGIGDDTNNGTLGQLQDPLLVPGMYRVGLALVLDYFGAKSVGFAASDPLKMN